MNQRQLFFAHIAPTSPAPMALEIVQAKGNWLIEKDGKKYFDAIGGIGVANIGHGNAAVIEAIKQQSEKYLHTMVYGELVQQPQVEYAQLLTSHLPAALNCVYFTNSGTEATEGALKLAKRITKRSKIIACHNSYHGSTQGALSLLGHEYWRNAFRPLLPGVFHCHYNSRQLIDAIDSDTACVVLETTQAESGVTTCQATWLQAVRTKCNQVGALLILDEAQCGFGRTGKLWAFEHYGVVPDILLLAKALGGGMPLGAFIASQEAMMHFTHEPVLGHITTFGGHPVCCAAGAAAFKFLLNEQLPQQAEHKGQWIAMQLQNEKGITIQRHGLWLSIFLKNKEQLQAAVAHCLAHGVFIDWFLFATNALRVCPPLTITTAEMEFLVSVLKDAICAAQKND